MKFFYLNIFLSKFLLIIILFSGHTSILICQNVVNNGNSLVINSGANLVISGNYINNTANASPGKVNLDGRMIVRGDWENRSSENNVLVNIEPNPDGIVLLDGNKTQNIKGINSTTFENLIITKSDKLLKVTDNTVKGQLTVDAVLNLNSNKIIIDNKNPNAINYISKYILSETTPAQGYGEVQWNIGDALALYQVPFGTGSASNDLNLSLNTTTSGQPSTGNIIFATYPTDCNNDPLPSGVNDNSNIPAGYVADRYWIINPEYSASKPNIDIEFTYTLNDIDIACNPNLSPQKLTAQSFCKDCGNGWTTVGNSNPAYKKVNVNGVLGTQCYAPWRLMSTEDETTIFYPDAFTPDYDGLNDKFGPKGYRMDLFTNYNFMIFNRWGDLIFQTEDINTFWDGTVKNTGVMAIEGVYVWVAKFINDKGVHKKINGKVTLLITSGDK